MSRSRNFEKVGVGSRKFWEVGVGSWKFWKVGVGYFTSDSATLFITKEFADRYNCLAFEESNDLNTDM